MTTNDNELPKKAKIPWLNRVVMAIVILATLVVGFIYANEDYASHDNSDNGGGSSAAEQEQMPKSREGDH